MLNESKIQYSQEWINESNLSIDIFLKKVIKKIENIKIDKPIEIVAITLAFRDDLTMSSLQSVSNHLKHFPSAKLLRYLYSISDTDHNRIAIHIQ